MSKDRLHRLGRCARSDERRRGGVSQHVDTNWGHSKGDVDTHANTRVDLDEMIAFLGA